MRSITDLELWIEGWSPEGADASAPGEMLAVAEETLEQWLRAHDKVPTQDRKEGFRLLALHRQAAQGDPSFNACRETCREAAYRFNLAETGLPPAEWRSNIATMRRVVQHLVYFIGGKLRNAQLGEFCCASRPIRTNPADAVLEGEDLR
jgi:hypothetical protein